MLPGKQLDINGMWKKRWSLRRIQPASTLPHVLVDGNQLPLALPTRTPHSPCGAWIPPMEAAAQSQPPTSWLKIAIHRTIIARCVTWAEVYLVQSDPVPGAAWVVGGHFEFCCGISNAVPLILHDECDQGDVHLVRELQRQFTTNTYTVQKHFLFSLSFNITSVDLTLVHLTCRVKMEQTGLWSLTVYSMWLL